MSKVNEYITASFNYSIQARFCCLAINQCFQNQANSKLIKLHRTFNKSSQETDHSNFKQEKHLCRMWQLF